MNDPNARPPADLAELVATPEFDAAAAVGDVDLDEVRRQVHARTAPAQLTLPGVQVTPIGAAVDPATPAAVLTAHLGTLSGAASMTRWVAGDLFDALARSLAPDADVPDDAAALEAVAPFAFERSWLADAITVARRIPAGHRRPELSWGHHALVAHHGIDVADQPRWLAAAVQRRWTKRQLADQVQAWLTRDQGALEGTGAPTPQWRPDRKLVGRIAQCIAVDPDAWVLVHPATGQVRMAGEAG